MADEKILFAADLDNKNFVQSAKQMRGELDNLAAPDRFSDVFSMLGKFGPLMGVITAAAAGAKIAFDAVLETENIERVNRQFTMLAGQVGLYGDKLADSLSVAVAGTKDMDDVLEVASRSMVALGSNAERLPEIFELSRKVVKLYGGDALETFDNLSNAIARGKTSALANYGVIVDQQKAYRDFAASIGVSDKALTEMQKKQARANEMLRRADEVLKGVDISANDFSTTIEKLKTSMGDFAEVFIVAIGKRAKPAFQSLMEWASETLGFFTQKTETYFADTEAGLAGHIEKTRGEITKLENDIRTYSEQWGNYASWFHLFNASVEDLAKKNADLAESEAKLLQMQAEKKAMAESAGAGQAGGGDAETKDFERSRQNQIIIEQNAQQQILGLRQNRIQAQMQIEGDAAQMDALYNQQKVVMEQTLQSQLTELRAQYALGQLTGEAEYQAKKVELEQTTNAQLAALRNQRMNGELQALENLANAQQRTAAGFSAGFKLATAQSTANITNFANLGKAAFGGLQGSLMAGYDALASGSEDAGEAMKKFFIGAIADKAAAAGAAMVLEAIWPPNPAAAAGGLALMALAGNLKRLAGGGGSSVSAGVSAGATTAAADIASPSGGFGGYGSSMAPEPAGPERKRSVTVQIAGNYLDTDQSRRYLLEMIRAETDATDFQYTQIAGVR